MYGTGGVGGYFGGRLAHAGADVVFLARGSHLQAMHSDGLRVESSTGDFTVQPVQASDDPASIGPVDLVLLGVKAWQVPEAARAMQPLVGPETTVLPLQNGVEAAGHLIGVLGRAPVIGGMCRIFSHIAAPGVIRHLSAEPFIALNELDNEVSERVRQIHSLLAGAGIRCEIAPDIHAAIWGKFAFVCSTGTMGAITRMPFGVVRGRAETRQMLEQAVQEVLATARAWGVHMPHDSFEQTMALVDKTDPGAITSMQRDIMEGRPSELGTQTGAVVRLGHAARVDVPLHTFVYTSLLPLELQARGEL